MNTVQTAVTAIRNADRNELNQIIEAVKLQQNFLARQSARTFMKGDAVHVHRTWQPQGGRNCGQGQSKDHRS